MSQSVGVIMQWWAATSRPEHQPLEEWTLSSHSVADSTGGWGGGMGGLGGERAQGHRTTQGKNRGSVESKRLAGFDQFREIVQ